MFTINKYKFNDLFKGSVSTVSSEPSGKSEMVSSLNTSTPQRYESDVEIISNPSESSIEVIDER